MDLPPAVNTGRDVEPRSGSRMRVCKRCKFSTTDAKEFLHHQMNAHADAIETYSCDKCDFLTAAFVELKKHEWTQHSTGRSASLDSEPGHLSISSPQSSETESEKHSEKSNLDPNEERSDDEIPGVVNNVTLPTRTYACQDCGVSTTSSRQHLRHRVEEHGYDYIIYECDICDYATRYKQKLPRHRKCHFTMPSEENSVKQMESVKMEVPDSNMNSIPRDSAMKTLLNREISSAMPFPVKLEAGLKSYLDSSNMSSSIGEGSVGHVDSKLLNGGSLLERTPDVSSSNLSLDQSNNQMQSDYEFRVGDGEESALVIDTQPQDTSSGKPGPASLTQGKQQDIPKKRPGPREAVDPAKYVRVQEVDGIKYACSKCGNVYKWKKSLNKHWKEKHDGEIPVPHSGNFPVLRVPSLRGSPNRSGNLLKDSSASSFLDSSMDDSLPTQVPFRGSSSLNSKADIQHTSPLMRMGGNYPGRESMPNLMRAPITSSTPVSRDRSRNMMWNSPELVNRTSTPSNLFSLGSGGKPKTDALTNIKMPYHPKQTNRSGLPPPAAHETYYGSRNMYKEETDDAIPLDLSSSAKHEVPTLSRPYLQSSLKKTSLPGTSPPGIQDEPLDFSAKAKTTNDSRINLSSEIPRMRLPVHVKDEHDDSSDKLYFRKPTELNGHKTVFGNWQCSVCAHVAKTKAEFEEHMEFHLKKRFYKCAECKQSFGEIEDLNIHFFHRHIDILKRSAQETEKYLPVSDKARESIQLYKFLTRAREPYFCVVCGQEFAWQWDLTRHFDQGHPTLPNPYKKRGQTEAGLPDRESPKRIRHNDSSLMCAQCSFVARSSEELSRHHLVHSLNLPFACTMCGYSAKYREELMTHIQKYHKKNLESSLSLEPLVMDLGNIKGEPREMSPSNQSACSQEPVSPKPNHPEHIVQMQTPDGGITTVDLNDEGTVIVIPEAPEETSSGSSRAKNLKVTKPDNSAETLLPYKCTKCEYRARWPSEINQHMKNHSDEKPFLCPFCNYKSKWKWDVVKHLKRCGGGTVKDVIDTSKQRKEDLSHWANVMNQQANSGCSPVNVLSNGPPNVTVLPPSPPAVIPAPSFQYEGASLDLTSRPVPYSRLTASLSPSSMNLTSPNKSTTNQGLYHCLQCPFVGNSPAELKRHCRVHSDEKPFMCLTCGYSSKWKCDLKKHLRTYNHVAATHLDTDDMFTRDPSQGETDLQCHEAAVENMDFDEEMQAIENQEGLSPKAELFRCDKCLYVTYKKQVLESHMKIHVQRSEHKSNRLKCKQCDFEADDLPSFLQHKVTHSNQQYPESNSTTGPSGYTGRDSSEDRDSEFGLNNKQSTSPTRHRRKPIMQFRCNTCPYTCLKRSDLELHEAVHESTNQDSYKCSFCEFIVNSRGLLMQHMKLHPEFNEDEDEEIALFASSAYDSGSEGCGPRNYSSIAHEFAQDKFWQMDHNRNTKMFMNSQTRSLSGAGYKCSKCPYVTSHRNNYEKHIVNHGTNNKYTCEWCDWSIDRINLLYRHAKCVHKNELSQQEKQDKRHKLGQTQAKYCHLPGSSEALDMSALDSKKSDEVASIGSHSGTGDNTPNESEMETEDSCTEDNGEETGKDQAGGPAKKKRKLRTCGECGYTTDNITNLQRHQKKHGQNGLYKCDFCNFSLDRLSLINQHMNMIHGTSRKGMRRMPKVIPPGAKQAHMSSDLLRQSPSLPLSEDNDEGNESEGSSTSILELEECVMNIGKVESTESMFIKGQYMQVLTTEDCKYYKCMKCAFVSRSALHLNRHSVHHAAGKRYTCEYCDYSLDQLHHILHHMRTVHQDEATTSEDSLLPEEKMEKEMEIQQFSMHSSLTDSVLLSKGGHEEEEEAEDLSLAVNRDLFLSSIGLKPVGEVSSTMKSIPSMSVRQRKPRIVVPSVPGRGKGRVRYRCTKCPYTTVYRGNIFKHRRQHVISSKYTCQYCNYSATRWHVLEKHVKFHKQELENPNKEMPTERFNDIYMDPDRDIEDALSDEGSMLLNFSSRGDYNSPISSPGYEGFANGQNPSSFAIDKNFPVRKSNSVKSSSYLVRKKKKTNRCDRCPYSTNSPVELDKHSQCHGASMKFKCDFCDFSVHRINQVYKHRKLHANEPDFVPHPSINALLSMSGDIPKDLIIATEKESVKESEENVSLDRQVEKSTADVESVKLEKTPSPTRKQQKGSSTLTFTPKLRPGLKGPSPLNKLRCKETKLPCGEFQCSHCPFACGNKQSFAYHETLHKGGGRYTCDRCSYSVNRVHLLQQHTRLHNIHSDMKVKKLRIRQPNKKRFKCPKCPYHTHSGVILGQHTKLHAAGKRFACQFCDYSIGRLNLLHQHLKLHVLSGNSNECDAQENEVPNDKETNHKIAVKEDKENLAKISTVFNPNSDDKVTPTNFSLSDKKFYYKCERCPYQTNNRGNFENHKSQHVVRSKLQCPYCDYSSPRTMQLGSHVKMHFPNSKLDSATLKSLIKEANQENDWSPSTPMTDDQEGGSPATVPEDLDDLDNHDAQNNNNNKQPGRLELAEHICQYCDRQFSDLADKTKHEKQHLVGMSVH